MLVIELSEGQVDSIFDLVAAHSGLKAKVDLPAQRVVFGGPAPTAFDFEFDAGTKTQLVEGLDDIDLTLRHAAAIDRFEDSHDPLI
jgi:3-isopropylmalate/(R)-2-methylmalate dehydratase small subunit